MPVQDDGTELLLGRGKMFFDRFDGSGNSTGLRFVGAVDKLEMNLSVEKKDYFTMSKAASTKIASNITQQTHEIDIQLREFTPDNLALALLGQSLALTQVAVTVAAGAETLSSKATPGAIYQTANRNISAVSAETGTTPLVAGTDYEVLDAQMGLIRVLPGTTALDGTKPLAVGYTAAAITAGKRITAGTASMIEGKLVFIGDPENGSAYDVEIWRVRLTPSGAMALINDDYGNIPLKGEAMDDSANHPADPLYHMTLRS